MSDRSHSHLPISRYKIVGEVAIIYACHAVESLACVPNIGDRGREREIEGVRDDVRKRGVSE